MYDTFSCQVSQETSRTFDQVIFAHQSKYETQTKIILYSPVPLSHTVLVIAIG
jgi:hypothetical protein